MEPIVLSGLLGGAGTLLGSVIGSIFGSKNTSDTNKQSMELAKYQYSKDLEMWNRNNEYNTPSAQMERLKQAGLNPNLVYGNGTVAGNTSGSTPSFHAPNLQTYSNFGDFGVGAGMNQVFQGVSLENTVQKTKAEIENINADTQVKSQEVGIKVLEAALKGIQKAKSTKELEIYDRLLKAQVEKIENEGLLTWSQYLHEPYKMDLTKQQRLNASYYPYFEDRKLRIGESNAVSSRIQANAASYNAASIRMRTLSEIERNTHLNGLTDAQLESVLAGIKGVKADSGLKELKFQSKSIAFKLGINEDVIYPLLQKQKFRLQQLEYQLHRDQFEHNSLMDWLHLGTNAASSAATLIPFIL